jgi:hypothetical protein
MTNTSFRLTDLEIVGYADVLTAPMLPAVVPPVFRPKSDPAIMATPPFAIQMNTVWSPRIVSAGEAEAMAYNRRITLFLDSPIQPSADHDLWLDENSQVRYAHRDERSAQFRAIHESAWRQALAAMESRSLDEADRFCNLALNAHPGFSDPYCLKAAICRLRGDLEGEDTIVWLARGIAPAEVMRRRIRDLIGIDPPVAAEASRRPMKDAATVRLSAAA